MCRWMVWSGSSFATGIQPDVESGADRQRAVGARTRTLDHLVETLADRFLTPAWMPRLPGTPANTVHNPSERSGPCAAGSPTPDRPSS
jgi:hypothetical protein